MSRRLKVLCFVLAIFAMGALAASCGSGNAQYRFVNTITNPFGPQFNVDIYVNTSPSGTGTPTPTFSNVAPGFVEPGSSGYDKLSAGTDPTEVFQTTQTTGAWINTALNLSDSTDYTIVLAGNNSASGSTYPYAAQVVTDTNPTPNSGQLEFRVLDAALSPAVQRGVPSVDVYIVDPQFGCCPSGAKVGSGLSYPSSNSAGNFNSNYQNVGLPTSGNLTVYVVPAGSTNPGSVVGTSSPIDVSAGTLHTVVLMDSPGGNSPVQFVFLTP